MFKFPSVDELRDKMLDALPSGYDKRPSTLVYTNLMAVAIEVHELYIKGDYILQNAFADTADREYLERKAREMSIIPYPATATKVKTSFNIDVGLGVRFQKDDFFFMVTKSLGRQPNGDYHAELTCETFGSLYNVNLLGIIIPVTVTGVAEEIDGLQRAEIIEVLETGEDEEDTEEFRKRYFDATKFEHYGGNIADYKQMAKSITGVGGVKVIPVWNGAGTVKLVITDSTYQIPSSEFIHKVKEIIDPVGNEGKGYGKAPIDHIVTIEAPTRFPIDVFLLVIYEDGQNWETVGIKVKKAIDDYFLELRKTWESQQDGIIIRRAYIESKVLDIDGIKDVTTTTLNGEANNISTKPYDLPVLGRLDVK